MGKIISINKNNTKRYNLIKITEESLVNIDTIDHQIYNNLPLNLYKEDNPNQDKLIKKILYKDEKYKIIEELPNYNYFITSFGRVFNIKRLKPMTIVNFRDSYLCFTCEKKRWKIPEIMEKAGFQYNMDKLIEYYKENDYPYRIN